MTKKDLFRIIIKIAGLYFLVTIVLFQLPSLLVFFRSSQFADTAFAIVLLVLFALVFVLLIFKPDRVINWLKLDKNFDNDTFSVQTIDFSQLLKLSILIIGIFLIIKYLPRLLVILFLFLQSVIGNNSMLENSFMMDYLSLGSSIVSLVIGYFMVTKHQSIANWIQKM